MNKTLSLLALISSLAVGIYPSEREWQLENAKNWNAAVDVPLADGSEADYVTETHAIEIDWASYSWAALAQAKNYARHTGKKPGVILLIKSGSQTEINEWRQACRMAWLCGNDGVMLRIVEVKEKLEGLPVEQ